MMLSAEDRSYILINVSIELEAMFTVMDTLCAGDDAKIKYLATIEATLKDSLKTLEDAEPMNNVKLSAAV